MLIPKIKIDDFPTFIIGILSLRYPLKNPPIIAPMPKRTRKIAAYTLE